MNSETTQHKSGSELIAEERHRQINEEGFSVSKDASYRSGELNDAAISYAEAAAAHARGESFRYLKSLIHRPRIRWPWDNRWWKPSQDPIRNLVKAGALIAAEIDRIQNEESDDRTVIPLSSEETAKACAEAVLSEYRAAGADPVFLGSHLARVILPFVSPEP